MSMTSEEFDIFIDNIEIEIEPVLKELEKTSFTNHQKVLRAFHNQKVSDYHLKGTTGYGYSDIGRDTLERVYADIFGAELGLVRSQIVSGTHAIALALYGNLRPGDELLSISGRPYDTLEEVIGLRGDQPGSLKDFKITYKEIDLKDDDFDYINIEKAISNNTRIIAIQRSRGYSWRASISISKLAKVIKFIKAIDPKLIVFVDNCYGEFVEELEPTQVDADLVAGSLIKNPGGGIAPLGGYVVGRKELVHGAANRLTSPGIAFAVGASLDVNRLFYQGLFLAPHVVKEALKGVIFAARIFEKLGFEVSPRYSEKRTDIIQAIKLKDASLLINFCQGLQCASPIDGHVIPEPATMPGYEDPVIMAGGTFIQGSSIELSADGPLREPYIAYLQGGLAFEYTKLGIINSAKKILGL